MIRLDSTLRRLYIVLAANVANYQPVFVASWSDATSNGYLGGSAQGVTTGGTATVLVPAPALGTVRDIDYIDVWNNDTAPVTVSIYYTDNATSYSMIRVTLQMFEQLSYVHGVGWKVLDANGAFKSVGSGGGSSTWGSITGTLSAQTDLQSALNAKEATANKDASGGYAGLTLFKLNLRNAANTFTSFLTNAATAARTWTMPDKDGTVAMTSDIPAVQTLQNVYSSRTSGTTYTNSTSQVIWVMCTAANSGASGYHTISGIVSGSVIVQSTVQPTVSSIFVYAVFPVPPASTYSVSVSGSDTPNITAWFELR